MAEMTANEVMKQFTPGDPRSWADEFKWLRDNHGHQIRTLTQSVLQRGIQQPILLGDDGRVWDGHHRLYVAFFLGLSVRVEYARKESDA